MSDQAFNPYQSPDDAPPEDADDRVSTSTIEGLWREGNLLVVREGCVFPARCVKTNEAATVNARNTFYWVPAWVWPILLIGPFAFPVLVGVLILMKVIQIEFPIAPLTARRRDRGRRHAVALGCAGVVALGLFLTRPQLAANHGPVAMGIALVAVGLAVWWYDRASAVLQVQSIKPPYAKFRGAHPDFLAQLPEFDINQL